MQQAERLRRRREDPVGAGPATHLLSERRGLRNLLYRVSVPVAQSAEDGALPTLLATVGDVPGDSYAGPGGFLEGRGAPTLVGRSARARDAAVARRLWDVSETLTDVRFPADLAGAR